MGDEYKGRKLNMPLAKDKHVIVDIRDGTTYESDSHDCMEALRDLVLEKINKKELNEQLATVCTSDILAQIGDIAGLMRLSSSFDIMKKLRPELFESETDYFTKEEKERLPIRYAGPFYTMSGCLHTKRLPYALKLTIDYLSKREQETDLTEEEIEIYLQTRAAYEYIVNPEFHG